MSKKENYKPRIGLKESLVDYYKQPIRYLKASNTVESKFEKPYRDLDYLKMHLEIPAPDWPGWNFPVRLAHSKGKYAEEIPGCSGCGMNWWRIRKERCDEDPINIHASWWCSAWDKLAMNWREKGVEDITIEVLQGKVVDMADGMFAGIFPDKDIWLDSSYPLHVIKARMTDIHGTPCFKIVEQECETCCPSGTFAFDDGSTPDTIAPSGQITLFVTPGCPPYTWSTSSNGYTLGAAQTEDPQNTLDSAGGVCGTDYDPNAIITVEDDCGDIVTIGIKNTGGQWATCGSGLNGGGCATATGAECSCETKHSQGEGCRILLQCGTPCAGAGCKTPTWSWNCRRLCVVGSQEVQYNCDNTCTDDCWYQFLIQSWCCASC